MNTEISQRIREWAEVLIEDVTIDANSINFWNSMHPEEGPIDPTWCYIVVGNARKILAAMDAGERIDPRWIEAVAGGSA